MFDYFGCYKLVNYAVTTKTWGKNWSSKFYNSRRNSFRNQKIVEQIDRYWIYGYRLFHDSEILISTVINWQSFQVEGNGDVSYNRFSKFYNLPNNCSKNPANISKNYLIYIIHSWIILWLWRHPMGRNKLAKSPSWRKSWRKIDFQNFITR